MFKITNAQMKLMDNLAISAFHKRLAKFLRNEVPEATDLMTDEALLTFIDDGNRQAAAYGIESEAGITQFVCLTFAAGANFHSLPAVQYYMGLPNLHPEEKLDELVNFLHAAEINGHANAIDTLLGPDA